MRGASMTFFYLKLFEPTAGVRRRQAVKMLGNQVERQPERMNSIKRILNVSIMFSLTRRLAGGTERLVRLDAAVAKAARAKELGVARVVAVGLALTLKTQQPFEQTVL